MLVYRNLFEALFELSDTQPLGLLYTLEKAESKYLGLSIVLFFSWFKRRAHGTVQPSCIRRPIG